MATRITVVLPKVRATPGAVVYAVQPMTSEVIGQVYLRKDKLRAAGHVGPWPEQITLTVEVE